MSYHPADDPNFSFDRRAWYLSHPLAPDEHYTFTENLNHTLRMLELVLEEGFLAVAPYHTHCLILDDNNPDHRRIGLETDVVIAKALGHIILTGHRISRGMQLEYDQCHTAINLTGLNDRACRLALREWRERNGA